MMTRGRSGGSGGGGWRRQLMTRGLSGGGWGGGWRRQLMTRGRSGGRGVGAWAGGDSWWPEAGPVGSGGGGGGARGDSWWPEACPVGGGWGLELEATADDQKPVRWGVGVGVGGLEATADDQRQRCVLWGQVRQWKLESARREGQRRSRCTQSSRGLYSRDRFFSQQSFTFVCKLSKPLHTVDTQVFCQSCWTVHVLFVSWVLYWGRVIQLPISPCTAWWSVRDKALHTSLADKKANPSHLLLLWEYRAAWPRGRDCYVPPSLSDALLKHPSRLKNISWKSSSVLFFNDCVCKHLRAEIATFVSTQPHAYPVCVNPVESRWKVQCVVRDKSLSTRVWVYSQFTFRMCSKSLRSYIYTYIVLSNNRTDRLAQTITYRHFISPFTGAILQRCNL